MRWAAIKLLEGDELFLETMPPIPPELNTYLEETRAHLEELYDDDVESIIVDQRYKVAEKLARESLVRQEVKAKRFTFDVIATHRIWAIPSSSSSRAGCSSFPSGSSEGNHPLLEGFWSLAEWVTVKGESWQIHPFLTGFFPTESSRESGRSSPSFLSHPLPVALDSRRLRIYGPNRVIMDRQMYDGLSENRSFRLSSEPAVPSQRSRHPNDRAPETAGANNRDSVHPCGRRCRSSLMLTTSSRTSVCGSLMSSWEFWPYHHRSSRPGDRPPRNQCVHP